MDQRIVYKNENGKTVVITPILSSGLTVEQIALKDVPLGVSYQIVSADQIQNDQPMVSALNRAQWGYFLDVTNFRATLNAVLDGMPKTTLQERAAWARLKSVALDSDAYSRANTLAIVAKIRLTGVSGLPTDQQIIDAWEDAALFNGAADLLGG